LAYANVVLDRRHGKPRDHVTVEQQDDIATPYPTLEEVEAAPIDRFGRSCDSTICK
jgi:hypothetical protein